VSFTEVDSPPQNNGSTGQVTTRPGTPRRVRAGISAVLATTTDKRGLLTNYTYDANGNLITPELTAFDRWRQ